MEQMEELQRMIEAILFAAGERIETSRLAMALETDEDEIVRAADALADKLAFAGALNQRYQLGVRQAADTIRFSTNDPEQFRSLVPCSEEPENYYITASNQLPTNGAKFCVILSEQLRFEKLQGISLPGRFLP